MKYLSFYYESEVTITFRFKISDLDKVKEEVLGELSNAKIRILGIRRIEVEDTQDEDILLVKMQLQLFSFQPMSVVFNKLKRKVGLLIHQYRTRSIQSAEMTVISEFQTINCLNFEKIAETLDTKVSEVSKILSEDNSSDPELEEQEDDE